MQVALYLRVSTDKQETENQAIQLREFAAKQNWTITTEYTDDGISGKNGDRPQFKKMLGDAHRRKFDILLFWSLSRLSREGTVPTLNYLKLLTSYGVCWKSYTQQFLDSCGIFKDAFTGFMAALDEQERIAISERTKAGLARVKAAGQRLGRPTTIAQHKDAVCQLRASGASYRAIATQLDISLGSVQRLSASAANETSVL